MSTLYKIVRYFCYFYLTIIDNATWRRLAQLLPDFPQREKSYYYRSLCYKHVLFKQRLYYNAETHRLCWLNHISFKKKLFPIT